MSGEAEHRTKVLRVATRCTSLDQFVEAFARYCEKRTLFVASLTTRSPGSQSPFVILLSDGAQALRGTCEVVEAWATPSGPFRRPGVRIKFLQLDAASEDVLRRLHKFKPPAPPAPKPPVLPPLPQMKTQLGVGRTPAPGTPVVAAAASSPVPTSVPASLPPLSRGTMRVQAVVPPPAVGLPPLAPLTPPPRVASVPRPEATPPPVPVPQPVETRAPSNVPEPVDAPYEPDADDAKTDVQGGSEDAVRAIRDAAPTDPPPFEERAPGSPIILPANPLAEITDDSLRGFVECTLYEETGKFSFDDLLERAGTDGEDEDPIAEPPPPPDLRASLPPELKPNPRRDATPLPGMALAAASIAAAPAPKVAKREDDSDEIPEVITNVVTPAPARPAPSPMTRTMIGHAPSTVAPPSTLGPIPGGNGEAPAAPPPAVPVAANPMFGDLAMPPPVGAEPIAPPPVYMAPPPTPPLRPTSASVDDDLVPARSNTLLYAVGAGVALIAAAVVVFLLLRGGDDAKADGKTPPPVAKSTVVDAGVVAALDKGTDTGSAAVETSTTPGSGSGTGTGSGSGTETETETETETGTGSDSGGQGAVADPDDGPLLTAADRVPPPVGDCSANIETTPAGALVRANGRYYGETPFRAALPCGRVTLSISYRRYATIEKTLTFSADKPTDIKLTMSRPDHKVKIVSTPGGATITIGGRKVGTTPATVTVPGYSMLSIDMRRAGFKTLRLKHYSKRSGEIVAGRLEKGR